MAAHAHLHLALIAAGPGQTECRDRQWQDALSHHIVVIRGALMGSDTAANPWLRWLPQAMEAAAAMADAVARQWLGVVVYPAQPKDAWVVEGLAARLREAFLRRYLGKNEATHRHDVDTLCTAV